MAATKSEFQTLFYGDDHETQFIRFYPSSSERSVTFAIIHGGYWKKKYGVDTAGIDSLVPFLTSRGYGVCLVEYRRVGHEGGGWPGTNDDVMKALGSLEEALTKAEMKEHKVVILGHSAGGTLALYASCKLDKLSDNAAIALCVAVAPVGNLEEGYERKLSDDGDAIPLYMGCSPASGTIDKSLSSSNDSSNRSDTKVKVCPYKLASPHHLLPLKTPCLITVGTSDLDVPPDMVKSFHADSVTSNNNFIISNVREYEEEMTSDGSKGECPSRKTLKGTGEAIPSIVNIPPVPGLLLIDGADHYRILDAHDDSWLQLFQEIEGLVNVQ